MAQATYSTNVTHLMGKPTIAVESGGLGRTDEQSVGTIERGVFNLLRHLGMLEGTPEPAASVFTVERDETLRSPTTGIFYPAVEVDTRVQQGQLLGWVTDFHGTRIHEARAPFEGLVLYILGTPPVSEGEPLVSVGRFATPPSR
jgi:predicted deacylase